MENDSIQLGMLNKIGHANFCMRCLNGLPSTMAEADSSRVAIGFYCLGTLDVLGLLGERLKAGDREMWRAWIWAQQVRRPSLHREGEAGVIFTSGNRLSIDGAGVESQTQRPSREQGSEDGSAGSIYSVGAPSIASVASVASSARKVKVPKHEARTSELGAHIGGFRPSPFMHVDRAGDVRGSGSESHLTNSFDVDPPHLIMTYTALLALAILRDDFAQLDRQGLIGLLRATQKKDGSFSAIPGQGEADIRMVYTAFAISAMLDDWSGVDVPRALAFTKRCLSYEGGFGQAPGNEAQGGPTYCALATLALAPASHYAEAGLSREERRRVERWLVQQQRSRRVFVRQGTTEGCGRGDAAVDEEGEEEEEEEEGGGFGGRTEKSADACYSFWCGAALRILHSGIGTTDDNPFAPNPTESGAETDERQRQRRGEEEEGLIDRLTHARFLSRCQFRLGGLGKAPGAHPDPYHTYLALAALSLYPPYTSSTSGSGDKIRTQKEKEVERVRQSWRLARLDPLINATEETADWAKARISGKARPHSLNKS